MKVSEISCAQIVNDELTDSRALIVPGVAGLDWPTVSYEETVKLSLGGRFPLE